MQKSRHNIPRTIGKNPEHCKVTGYLMGTAGTHPSNARNKVTSYNAIGTIHWLRLDG